MRLDINDAQIEAARNGNMQSLLLSTLPYVRNILKNKLPDCDIDDISQEVGVHIVRNLANLHNNYAYVSWVRTLTNNAIATYWRQKLSHKTEMLNDDLFLTESTDDQAIKTEETFQLHEAIEKLPAQDQMVLKYHYMNDEKITDIAQRLNKPSGTVRRWLHNARKALSNEISV